VEHIANIKLTNEYRTCTPLSLITPNRCFFSHTRITVQLYLVDTVSRILGKLALF
jgi:hypothetical protein